MKSILFIFLFLPIILPGQSISINSDGSDPDPSAILELKSDNKGFLLPRTDTSNISTPSKGLIIYQLTDDHFYFFNGYKWDKLSEENFLPKGAIAISDTFPNEGLENAGFSIYGSYEQTYTDLYDNGINYGEWTFLSDTLPSSLIGNKGFWTGNELIIWGGDDFTRSNYGAKYDPITHIWEPMSLVNAPSPRRNFAIQWTGSKLLIFGGDTEAGDKNDMYEYDPINDTWSEIFSSFKPSERKIHKSVWVNDSLIIWGGEINGAFVPEGFIYDYGLNSWSIMNSENAPQQGAIAYVNDKLFVFGGGQYNGYPQCTFIGVQNKFYDMNTKTWQSYITGVKRLTPKAITAGDFVYLYGGYEPRYTVNSPGPFGGEGSCSPNGSYKFGLYAKYNSITSSAENGLNNPITEPKGSGSKIHMVYTGDKIIFWGDNNGFQGMLIDPLTDENTPISTVNAPSEINGFTSVWAGDKMLAWSYLEGFYAFDPNVKGIGPIKEVSKTMYMYIKE